MSRSHAYVGQPLQDSRPQRIAPQPSLGVDHELVHQLSGEVRPPVLEPRVPEQTHATIERAHKAILKRDVRIQLAGYSILEHRDPEAAAEHIDANVFPELIVILPLVGA